MGKIERFEDLEVWQLSRGICKEIWKIMETTSLKTDFKLRDQMNGSSGSVMDNIAEGFERDGNREFLQFLSIAQASCGELRSQLYRCLDRNHIDRDTFDSLRAKTILTNKKIKSLIIYLKKSKRRGFKYD